jgi:membrane protease YdiL (CAAX protease family)
MVFLALLLNVAVAVVAQSSWLPQASGAVAESIRLALLALTPYALTFAAIWGLMRRHGYSWSQGLGLRRTELVTGAALAAIVAFLGRVVASVWTGFLAARGLEPPANLDVTSWFPSDPLGITFLILLSVVVAPVVEEMVYRGMLFPSLRPRVGPGAALLISGLAFGIAHVSLVWLLVPTSVLGMMLARAFERTRSLHVAILAHALFNLVAVFAVLALGFAGVD